MSTEIQQEVKGRIEGSIASHRKLVQFPNGRFYIEASEKSATAIPRPGDEVHSIYEFESWLPEAERSPRWKGVVWRNGQILTADDFDTPDSIKAELKEQSQELQKCKKRLAGTNDPQGINDPEVQRIGKTMTALEQKIRGLHSKKFYVEK